MTDAATSAFLEAATDDLRRQLGIAGSVEGLTLEGSQSEVTLVAAIRVAGDELVIRGTGDSLVTAYTHLLLSIPQPVLESAFVQVVDI